MTPSITEWLALYDHLERVYRARDHPGVDAAFLSLATHDHALTMSDRIAARVARWRRDAPDEPLPPEEERAWWGHCLCRVCAAARRASAGTLAPWQRQLQTLQRQKIQQPQRKGHRV
ncbi:MAG: hypothetical protein H0U76_27955, partial [Ktedonobacteraceae bacterium]|nr:hypothetical protein [Ktedonobacteraceae bacterium]MBA3823718.1 hypothetical protein [Ktedonobacterales bacterium]